MAANTAVSSEMANSNPDGGHVTNDDGLANSDGVMKGGVMNGHDTKAPPSGKLHGRAFWESIGSPRLVLAPMVDQSEFVGCPLCVF